MKTQPIERCPACGGTDIQPLLKQEKHLSIAMYCRNCRSQAKWRRSLQGAIAAWNTLATDGAK